MSNTNTKLFEHIVNVLVPESTERFVAKEKFIVRRGEDSPVRIDHVDLWFDQQFLSGAGRIEKPAKGCLLSCERLTKLSKSEAMFTELGGKERSEILLSSIYALVEQQGHGEPGILLVDGWWNLFVAYGWTVGARWNGMGWCFIASKASVVWGADVLIFSPITSHVDVLA